GGGCSTPSCITEERCNGHGLAAAVDAALRIDESVETRRNRPPRDAAVGQVKRRRFEAEESVIALLAGNDGRRGNTTLAARQPGLKMDEAIAIGLADSEHLVVARNQAHLDTAARICTGERVYKDINAVVRRVGGEPEIGDDEPLRRLLPVFGRNDVLRLGGHSVEARGEILDRLIEWKRRGHLGVEFGLNRQLTNPDF